MARRLSVASRAHVTGAPLSLCTSLPRQLSRGQAAAASGGTADAPLQEAPGGDEVERLRQVLRHLGKRGRWRRALAALDELQLLRGRRHATAEDAASEEAADLNVVLSACARASEWARALALLHGMDEGSHVGVRPNTVHFNTAIGACQRGRHWEMALALFAEMPSRGLSRDLVTHSAALSACERAGEWRRALAIFAELREASWEPDSVAYGAAVLSCWQGDCWEASLALLSEAARAQLAPDASSCSRALAECERRGLPESQAELLRWLGRGSRQPALSTTTWAAAALRLLAAGQDAEAGAVLEEAAARGTLNAVSARLRAALRSSSGGGAVSADADAETSALTSSVAAASSRASLAFKPRNRYAKELRLLQHVLETSQPGDPASVCASMEQFSRDVLEPAGLWLKVAGGGKLDTILSALKRAPQKGGGILEIGTYCGYSALQMAMALPDASVTTFEVDPVHMAIALNVVAWAGLSHRIDIWTGHSAQLLPRLAAEERGPFRAVFMDQRGSRYVEDLENMEQLGLLHSGAVVIADNVLKPGAPLYLWRVCRGLAYSTEIVSVREFGMASVEDWLSVTFYHPPKASSEAEPQTAVAAATSSTGEHMSSPPRELVALEEEADRLRAAASDVGQSSAGCGVTSARWTAFGVRMRAALARAGIAPTKCEPAEA
eukprot:TRINITY_DN64725_c0_g1_i1.p1 TRINITY_DN64725_c0_g1~~TRINITY_DN64725_c0_g1_i1.p1  ORF type:complete len:669 (-),score=142.85 TRINITY_DN64725_c0_g1_i1:61-2067(-)